MIKLLIANLKQLFRNRQALFWSLAFPLIFTVIFGFFFGQNTTKVGTVALVNKANSPLASGMEKAINDLGVFTISKVDSIDAARQDIKKGTANTGLIIPEGFGSNGQNASTNVTVLYDPGAVQAHATLTGFVNSYLTQTNYQVLQVKPVFGFTEEQSNSQVNYGYFDYVLVGLIGMALMNSAVQGIAIAMAKYRDDKILKRITTTPLPGWKFIIAEVVSRLVLNVIQVGLVILVGMRFFGAHIGGSLWVIAGIALLGAVLFQLIGFSIAAVTKNADAAEGMATAVTVPMMFLSGVFFAIDQLPGWLHSVVQYLPLSPLLKSMRSLALEGGTLADNVTTLGIVLAWIVAMLAVTIWKFRLTEE